MVLECGLAISDKQRSRMIHVYRLVTGFLCFSTCVCGIFSKLTFQCCCLPFCQIKSSKLASNNFTVSSVPSKRRRVQVCPVVIVIYVLWLKAYMIRVITSMCMHSRLAKCLQTSYKQSTQNVWKKSRQPSLSATSYYRFVAGSALWEPTW